MNPKSGLSMSRRKLLSGIKILLHCFMVLMVIDFCYAQQDWNPRQYDDPAVARVPLPGTVLLTMECDIAASLVEGVDCFLLREIEKSSTLRAKFWNRNFSSPEAYNRSIEPNRKRLAHITGVRDARIDCKFMEFVGTTEQPALIGEGENYNTYAVRWHAFGDVNGEGLMMMPKHGGTVADIIAIPDADVVPEMIAGLLDGVPPESQYARRLAESGCRVIVPMLIDRRLENYRERRNFFLTHREFLYRSAYEMGRHIIGYELQKILALIDWFTKESSGNARIGVIGWGEGGLLSMYAAALDTRIDAAVVSGYFDSRQNVWQEPVDRNVFGLLEQFGDAEIAGMVAPRPLIIETAKGPEVVVKPGNNGAPGRITTPRLDAVRKEFHRARWLVSGFKQEPPIELIVSGNGSGSCGTEITLQTFLHALAAGSQLAPPGGKPNTKIPSHVLEEQHKARHERQMHEIDRHTQWLLGESPYIRNQFMKKLNTESLE